MLLVHGHDAMSILGVIVRTRLADRASVAARLSVTPGVDLALDPGDGRMVLVLENAATQTAAATLAQIAQWPQVLNTSLVYEHAEPGDGSDALGPAGYSAWRASPGDAFHQSADFPSTPPRHKAQETD
jgi:nitrate reductase NapD